MKSVALAVVGRMERLLRGRNAATPEHLRGIRNFLVLQLESPLGSVVHATPLYAALRQALPHAYIAVAASPMAESVLALDPAIDCCVRIPDLFTNFRASRATIQEILRGMPSGPTAILTTIGNQRTRVAVLALLAGNAIRAGHTLAPELYDIPFRFHPERGQIEGNLDILRRMGIAADFSEPHIWFSQPDADRAAQWLAPISGPRIVFVTQNSGGQKNQWSPQRFQQVIAALSETRDGTPVFVGTAADATAIDALRQPLANPGISLAGKTSIRELAAVLAQCDLIVSLDTGTFHVARAVGLPGVVVAPAWQSALEWLPVGHSHYRVLQGPRLPAPTPGYWIEEISTGQVTEAAVELLEKFPPSNSARQARIVRSISPRTLRQ
jgi:ADP-heptose:LPS heptosyltransferase